MRQLHRTSFKRHLDMSRFLLGIAAFILIGLTTPRASAVQLQLERFQTPFTGGQNETPDVFNNWSFSTEPQGSLPTDFGLRDLAAADESRRASFNIGAAPNDIRLAGYQSQVISSAFGSTVTVNLQNFSLSGHSTLTLLGDSTSTFIINVTNQFSLTQNAKVLLSGGLQWNHVFFNILGTGPTVSLGGKSILVGTLTASQRKVVLSGHAVLYGVVSAQRTLIRQAAQIVTPPIVSP